jgi:hypothetical protein
MNTKKCTKCFEILTLDKFNKDKTNKNGLCYQCKKCKFNATKKLRELRKELVKEIITEKICTRCKELKTINNFCKCKTNKDGFNVYCKKCRNLNDKDRKINRQENVIIIKDNYNKKCTICDEVKFCKDFKINRKSSDNFSHICISCSPINNWSKEKQRESEKKYRLNNPEKIKEKYKRQSLKINRRIRDSLNKRIKGALFSKKYKKTLDYVGCSIEELQKWFETLFKDGMSWDNYGQWHIDHVKPCSSYDLSKEDQIIECFNWKNLQPLWAKDNLTKSNKINNELILEHYIKVHNYNYKNIIPLFSAQV